MKKEVLVIHYSQSGQLTEILDRLVEPLQQEASINLHFHNIAPVNDFPFPWPKDRFFDTFPETYFQIPQPLHPIPADVLQRQYDLIVFGYQIWFLTPSIPASSFLQEPTARQLFADTPVITVIGCRNMWVMAHEKLKKHLADLGARLVGQIVLADRAPNHISVLTISHWMFSGRKDRWLGIFPKPGVSDKDIREATRFGIPIREALLKGDFEEFQPQLLQLGALLIKPFLLTVEKRGNYLFGKWAAFLIKKGRPGQPERLRWVKVFNYYLLFAIWIIAPIVFILFLLTFLFKWTKMKKDIAYHSSVAYNGLRISNQHLIKEA